MIKPEQIKTLDNDSIIDQLHLILNKIEELDLMQGTNPDKTSESKQAAWLTCYRKTSREVASLPLFYCQTRLENGICEYTKTLKLIKQNPNHVSL